MTYGRCLLLAFALQGYSLASTINGHNVCEKPSFKSYYSADQSLNINRLLSTVFSGNNLRTPAETLDCILNYDIREKFPYVDMLGDISVSPPLNGYRSVAVSLFAVQKIDNAIVWYKRANVVSVDTPDAIYAASSELAVGLTKQYYNELK